jgi:hypothetical protein
MKHKNTCYLPCYQRIWSVRTGQAPGRGGTNAAAAELEGLGRLCSPEAAKACARWAQRSRPCSIPFRCKPSCKADHRRTFPCSSTSPLRRVAVPTMKLIAGNLDNSMSWQSKKWLARRLLFPKANGFKEKARRAPYELCVTRPIVARP